MAKPISVCDSRLLARCQQAISEQLPCGCPTISETARLLGVSVRTLQRRLDDRGLTYSELLDHDRFTLACRLLWTADTPVAEVAGELGYADPSSFSRAFRRWLGTSPREYRRRRRHHGARRSGRRAAVTA
jgi:AraC-like DNA-binding protein